MAASSSSDSSSSSEKKLKAISKRGTWKQQHIMKESEVIGCKRRKEMETSDFIDTSSVSPQSTPSKSQASSQHSTPSSQGSVESTPVKQKAPVYSSSTSSSYGSTMPSINECMIKEGHQLASFYAFKDWTDCASFILNEKTEYTINIVSEQQVPIYPGIFTGCSDCVQVHSASTFQSSLGQVNWALLRTSPVPLNTPLNVKDLATCCRAAAVSRFKDGPIKEFISSILRHVRQHYICPSHGEHVHIYHPVKPEDDGGVFVPVDVSYRVVSTTTGGSDISGRESNACILKGKPDVSLLVDDSTVLCAEGKCESLNVQPFQVETSKIGQALFYATGLCLSAIKKTDPGNKVNGHCCLYVQGQQAVLCSAEVVTSKNEVKVYIGDQFDLLSSGGLAKITHLVYQIIQKSLDYQ